jgi:hypothetical protein
MTIRSLGDTARRIHVSEGNSSSRVSAARAGMMGRWLTAYVEEPAPKEDVPDLFVLVHVSGIKVEGDALTG